MGIVLAILVFSGIVLFHEFGHFLLAKWNRITVLEFSLGMGPRIWSIQGKETRYSLKLLPFGGSCMMLGEDEADDSPGAFGSKSVWARISVVAAGPIFNFLLAFLMSVILLGCTGYDVPVLKSITEGSPAEAAGLQAGDQICRINGKKIHFGREAYYYCYFHEGETLTFTIMRDGEKKAVTITPALSESGTSYKFGFAVNMYDYTRCNVLQLIPYGFYELNYWIDMTISSLKMIVTGGVSIDDVSGPVGVVSVIDETYQASKTDGVYYIFLNMLSIAILLSANLGVMNLLPIPALDGGRLVFLILEAIRRKRISAELEGRVHLTGLAVLLVFMVFIMYKDIMKLFL